MNPRRRARLMAATAAALVLMAGCLPKTSGRRLPPTSVVSPASIATRAVIRMNDTHTERHADVTVHTLKNGFQIIHRHREENDIVGLVLAVRTGTNWEPDAKVGATTLLARVMPKGTRRRTAEQIAEELGQMGAGISINPGYDYFTLSMKCVRADLGDAIELLADIALAASLPEDEIERERERAMAVIRRNHDQTSYRAALQFRANLFGRHPYGRPIDGTEDTLRAITRADLMNVHEANFVPSNMALGIVGNVPEEQVTSLAERHFGRVTLEKAPIFTSDQLLYPGGSRQVLYKEAQQGYAMVGVPTCELGHADEPAVEVASAILGGGMSSRLFRELRDKQGLAYSVGAGARFYRQKGYLVASIGTKAETLGDAERGLWRELRALREEPVPEEELQRAKNYIAGEYLRERETNMAQASYLTHWHVSGLGVERDQTYLDAIEATTTRDIMRVANKYILDPTVVIVMPTKDGSPLAELPVPEFYVE